ncbi:MAG: hypothetical protein Q8M79_08995 [Dehalococcoidia bacterium]|nr:hypothetical protein [Dehalococcoidia bacterium]
MILFGYGAMILMGLLPLMGLAHALDVADQQRFLLPWPWAIAASFLFGFVLSYILGRALGLVEVAQIGTYEERRDTVRAEGILQPRRMAATRYRRAAAAPIHL